MTDAEYTAREYLRGVRDPLLAVGGARWNVWRWSLSQDELAGHLVDDAAGRLNLPWPRSRTGETLAVYGGLELDEVLSQPGIGFQKARTVVWAMGLVASGGDVVALAKDVMRGPDAVLVERPDPSSPGRSEEDESDEDEPDEEEPDATDVELDRSLSVLEDAETDEPVAPDLRALESALADLAAQRAGGGETGDRLRAFVFARLGEGGEQATLQEIGQGAGLSRERVRQVLATSNRRLRYARPGVEDRLVALYRRWLLSGRGTEDLSRLRHLIRVVFGERDEPLSDPQRSLSAEVRAVVRRAYLDGDTPLEMPALAERLRQRLGATPDLGAVRRACAEGVVLTEVDGTELAYSDSSKDLIHRVLLEAGRPLDHGALQAATGLTRGTLYSLTGKDARLIQQDDGTWVPSRDLPVREVDGGWSIDAWRREAPGDFLDELMGDVFADVTPRRATREVVAVPLGDLVGQAVQDLVDRGVYNATVGGFWRACAAVAERTYGAELPESVAAVPLGRLATDRTPHVVVGGKRRVGVSRYPDRVQEQDNAHWVRRAFRELGGPCTVDELSRVLDAHYQDGPPYLHKMWVELYADDAGFRRFAPEKHPQMSVLVPSQWDPAQGGESPGVRRLARRIGRSATGRYGGLCREDFAGAEWLADLIDDEAGGFLWATR